MATVLADIQESTEHPPGGVPTPSMSLSPPSADQNSGVAGSEPRKTSVYASQGFGLPLVGSFSRPDNVPADRKQILESFQPAEESRDISSSVGTSATTSLDALQASFKAFFTRRRQSEGADASRMKEYQEFFLGCGYVRFAGLRTIETVVKLTENPNDRQNPRDKQKSHLEALENSIAAGKFDWQHPLIIFVSPDLVSDEMASHLKSTPSFQPWSEPALFQLNNSTKREQQLEEELFFERVESALPGQFFTAEELKQKAEEYTQLLTGRQLAELGNGNHRIEVMRRRSETIVEPLRKRVIQLQKQRFLLLDESVDFELKTEAKRLKALLQDQTWQVLVFRDDAPPELRLELVRNEPQKPTLGASVGEEIWLMAQKIEAAYERFKSQFPQETRAELMDRVHYEFSEAKKKGNQITVDIDNQPDPSTNSPNPATVSVSRSRAKKDSRSRVLGGAGGGGVWHRATTEPCVMEMMLSTRYCLHTWTKILSSGQVTSMLRETGAVITAKIWLALEILQLICNTPDASPLQAIESFLDDHPVSAQGYTSAVDLWLLLHEKQDRIPLNLDLYDEIAANRFTDIYKAHFNLNKKYDQTAIDRDWEEEDTLTTLRTVFDDWGTSMRQAGSASEGHRRMSLAARLYSRLPTWTPDSTKWKRPGSTSNIALFFSPRSSLPSFPIILQWSRLADSISSGAGIECLEFLLDRHKLMWTMGSGDAGTRCKANWYLSGRGPYHILMSFFQAEDLGPLCGRLTEAIKTLDSTSFRTALLYVNSAVSPQHRVKEMRTAYGANKSQGLQVDLSAFEGTHHRLQYTSLGSIDEVIKKMQREALPDILRYIEEGDSSRLCDLLRQHPCLNFVSDLFWSTAPIIRWGSGWGNVGAQRRRFTAGVIMGWGMLEDAYQALVTDQVLMHRRVWHLVEVAALVADLGGVEPWWRGIYDVCLLRMKRAEARGGSATDADSDASDESDEETRSDNNADPQPRHITGSHNPVDHVTRPRNQRPPPHDPTPGSSSRTSLVLPRKTKTVRRKVQTPARFTKGKSGEKTQRVELATANPSRSTTPAAPTPSSTVSLADPSESVVPIVSEPQNGANAKLPTVFSPGSPGQGSLAVDRGMESPEIAADSQLIDNLLTASQDSLPEIIPETPPQSPTVEQAMTRARSPWPPIPVQSPRAIDSDGGMSVRQILRQVVPPPLVVVGCLTMDLLPGFDGQVVAFRTSRHGVDELEKWRRVVEVCGSYTESCMALAFKARNDLRQDIVAAVTFAFTTASPPVYVLENLAPQLYMIKLTYVKQLAATFSAAGLSDQCAFAEAAFMVGSDRTLITDSFSWDRETGEIKALLHHTLPLSAQNSVSTDESSISIGFIERTNTEKNLEEMSPYVMSVLAQGHTQGASLARACANVITRSSVALQPVPDDGLVLEEADRAFQDPHADFNQTRVFRTLGCDGDLTEAAIACGWQKSPSRDLATRQNPLSCFSTGIWCRPNSVESFGQDDRAGDALRKTISNWTRRLDMAWEGHLSADLENLSRLRTTLRKSSTFKRWPSVKPDGSSDRPLLVVPYCAPPVVPPPMCPPASQQFPSVKPSTGIQEPRRHLTPDRQYVSLFSQAQGSRASVSPTSSLGVPSPGRVPGVDPRMPTISPLTGSKRGLDHEGGPLNTKRSKTELASQNSDDGCETDEDNGSVNSS